MWHTVLLNNTFAINISHTTITCQPFGGHGSPHLALHPLPILTLWSYWIVCSLMMPASLSQVSVPFFYRLISAKCLSLFFMFMFVCWMPLSHFTFLSGTFPLILQKSAPGFLPLKQLSPSLVYHHHHFLQGIRFSQPPNIFYMCLLTLFPLCWIGCLRICPPASELTPWYQGQLWGVMSHLLAQNLAYTTGPQ